MMTSASRVPVLFQNKCPLPQEYDQESVTKDTLSFDRCAKIDKEFENEQEKREVLEDLVSFKSQLGLIKTTQPESKKAVYNWVGTRYYT